MLELVTQEAKQPFRKRVEELQAVTIRFAGDSGDGMQLAGTQFSISSAIFGNDISTLPDYPAEIRAPAGSLGGVSGFQINFSANPVHTPGDRVNALIAMNPAALKTNLPDVEPGGLVVVNSDAFTKSDLAKAGYTDNPLEDEALNARYRLVKVPLSRMNAEALAGSGLTAKIVDRCKNFFALGLVYWLYDRPLEPTLRWIEEKFAKKPEIADANIRSLKAGYSFGETTDAFAVSYRVAKAKIAPGRYRTITGNEATALGLVTAAKKSGRTLFYGTYPITPASEILHQLSRYKNFGVLTFQAEDEIAGITSAIGAAFGGAMGVTGTSGPGMALKTEAIGLAVMTELPLIIINVQRGGPSTGLPTKTEQADLLQAVVGRNGECPVPVLAAQSPTDCFWTAIEAWQIATRFMTPVIVLSDGYIANGAEPWRIPTEAEIPAIEVPTPQAVPNEQFYPYARNADLARPWALPGTPGLEHRIGGLEKQNITGAVCYEAQNHDKMVRLRAQKVANVAKVIPPVEVSGPPSGDLLVIGWGGTYGAITAACQEVRARGRQVSNLHLRHLNPFPANLGEVLARFKRILVPELNLGQLLLLLRGHFQVNAIGFSKVQGKPFLMSEIEAEILRLLDGE
ncbi:MAG TPA: 2-oxoacid:acceptor oxidoreductase subunit alpha [Phycisphaerae bacterium]|nr:2-oxoacid:acceptor oxidoreductase subunit alpha [Phycisphaerae bacterium]HOB74275.1 2-oxoacid:acceptor oxidoreductase subunit alpha [Phycisphaerae bacterium]HOJ53134.1 2-oxoacid:acceptor oxidoreductase subunit alpha [Phycisphaerae bacterium]HOL24871.1 2-oxoacid:acceptor oxidoreductase subunit alpha [Phycisphaerae bacterium]HPP19407.1 2-oxoacid:acceptor oxidoreductase subunit alpha [Phycisphaerae bacterium]